MITLTTKQAGVARGMVAGLLITAIAFLAPAFWSGCPRVPADTGVRLSLWISADAIVAFWLFFAIARLARHRFFTPEDIDGGGTSDGSAKARLLQSLLQNTLEQTALAVVAYGCWFVLASERWAILPVFCSVLFSVGRLLFFIGYAYGAPARAIGFALTFYPSVALLLGAVPIALQTLTTALTLH